MYLLKAVAGRLTSFQALDTHQYGPDNVSAEFLVWFHHLVGLWGSLQIELLKFAADYRHRLVKATGACCCIKIML